MVKSRQQLSTCILLGTKRGIPRRFTHKVPSLLRARHCPRLLIWIKKSFLGPQCSMKLYLKLQARLWRRKWLILPIIATWICSSGAIRLATLRLRSVIRAPSMIFPSYNYSVCIGLTTREKHYLSEAPPLQPVSRRLKVLALAFSMGQHSRFSQMRGVGFMRCVRFKKLQMLHRLRLLYWCGVLRYSTAAQLWKRKRSSSVTLQIMIKALCVAVSLFCDGEVLYGNSSLHSRTSIICSSSVAEWWELTSACFLSTSCLAIVLKNTSSISGQQSSSFNAPIFLTILRISVGRRRGLGCLAYPASIIEFCFHPGKRKNAFGPSRKPIRLEPDKAR